MTWIMTTITCSYYICFNGSSTDITASMWRIDAASMLSLWASWSQVCKLFLVTVHSLVNNAFYSSIYYLSQTWSMEQGFQSIGTIVPSQKATFHTIWYNLFHLWMPLKNAWAILDLVEWIHWMWVCVHACVTIEHIECEH